MDTKLPGTVMIRNQVLDKTIRMNVRLGFLTVNLPLGFVSGHLLLEVILAPWKSLLILGAPSVK